MKNLPEVKIFTLLPLTLAAVAAASAASADFAASPGRSCQDISKLKAAYLRCEHAAQSGKLGSEGIAECSGVYYRLKAEAFDDDFAKIRDWYDLVVSVHRLDGSWRAVATVASACD